MRGVILPVQEKGFFGCAALLTYSILYHEKGQWERNHWSPGRGGVVVAKGNVRVVLASEHARVRDFLGGLVEGEAGVEVIGQAHNAVKAVSMARSLRPDIAVIDCHLPHGVGLDTVPLSRASGLDAAQAISSQMPETRVILVNNLDSLAQVGRRAGPSAAAYCIANKGTCVLLSSGHLFADLAESGAPLMASIEVRPAALQQKVTHASEMVVFFGALAFGGGLALTLTMWLAPIGLPLAILGAATVAGGLVARVAASLWQRVRGQSGR